MTSVDLHYLLLELAKLKGARVKAVYDCGEGFRFKLRLEDGSEEHLLVEPPKFFMITKFEQGAKPSSPCMLLRKHLENASISSISQANGDRVAKLVFSNGNTLWVELLSKGNIVLEKEKTILWCLQKDDKRGIMRGKPYALPASAAKPIEDLVDFSNAKEIARFAGLPSMYVEDALKNASSLEEAKAALLGLFTREPNPALHYDANGSLVGFSPFPLKKFVALEAKKMPSLSAALEEYFENASDPEPVEKSQGTQKAEKLEVSLENQKKAIVRLQESAAKDREKADFILAHSAELEELVSLAKARKMEALSARAKELGFSKATLSGKVLKLVV